ncbi:xyloglucan alpha-1,2-fucosyltransferase, family GT37 [Zostera marina]|uniref:Fucosyltransferase n=1 Tax=Zostera marina TaxID=29655 RepID=A0A0K9PLX6_ZOSMR|nr:xyloglucan alpha-1,2-fucosyltransferase, family GT37 [Zostera marina]
MKRSKRRIPSSPQLDLEGPSNDQPEMLEKSPYTGAIAGGRISSSCFLVRFLMTCLLLISALIIIVICVDVRFRQRSSSELHIVDDALLRITGKGLSDEDIAVVTKSTSRSKHLGGLLAVDSDDKHCVSKHESFLIRRRSHHRKPSTYLQERLRSYESLHRQCSPHTDSYNKSMTHWLVKSNPSGSSPPQSDCRYLVWISYSGLGNRMLSLTSAFLYALLTNRVLLIDRRGGVEMDELFCNPFPQGSPSWILPPDFALSQQELDRLGKHSPSGYGNMVKRNKVENNGYIYVHLSHDYDEKDKLFFCDKDQAFLQRIPLMVLRSNNYFAPSMFLIESYEEELTKLFPEKDTVFHHLGRYLFHPSNTAWGLITRYYQAYLAMADERIGIQIRVFDDETGPFEYVIDQILSCTSNNKLLPDVSLNKSSPPSKPKPKSKALLLTSLSSGYFERLRNRYWEHPTINGDVISVHQPSQEEHQKTDSHSHNMKAWAEMYLLSLTDVLVTSSWSTFGYVAQGLGGLTPWILTKSENRTVPVPACVQATSMEPCFHAPPFYNCKTGAGIDTGTLVPHVKHCEDMTWGLKLVRNNE